MANTNKRLVSIPTRNPKKEDLQPIADISPADKATRVKKSSTLAGARKTATVKKAATQASNSAVKKATGLAPIESASAYKARQQRSKSMGTARQRATVKSKKK